MGIYKDAQNYVPYDFNTSVLTLDGEINVDGLDSFSATKQADRVVAQTVADGLGILVLDPSKVVEFAFTNLAAAVCNDDLWTLLETDTPFKLTFSDSNAPNLACTGAYCMFVKTPTISRAKEAPMLEWSVITAYGSMKGGSFTLSS